jgi:hypothetical protein
LFVETVLHLIVSIKIFVGKVECSHHTFLFQSGAHTVTLLDMHRIMGLPLDGEFYEEFIPHYHERDPSMLLYPKCLAQLFAAWDELQVDGDVSLQEWCDYFHNGPRGPGR